MHSELRVAEAPVLTRDSAGSSPAECTNFYEQTQTSPRKTTPSQCDPVDEQDRGQLSWRTSITHSVAVRAWYCATS